MAGVNPRSRHARRDAAFEAVTRSGSLIGFRRLRQIPTPLDVTSMQRGLAAVKKLTRRRSPSNTGGRPDVVPLCRRVSAAQVEAAPLAQQAR